MNSIYVENNRMPNLGDRYDEILYNEKKRILKDFVHLDTFISRTEEIH